MAPGAKIKSLSILVDEGTDTTSIEDVFGVGLSVVDNIDVNGTLITQGPNNGNGNGNNGNGNGNNGNGNGNNGDQKDKGDK